MESCNLTSTPLATDTKLLKSKESNKMIDQRPYQQLVGSQIYSIVSTRPNTAYLLSQISQFNASLNSTHEAVAKRSLRYLAGTPDMGITYDGTERLVMKAYCDADYVAKEDRKSIFEIVIIMAKGAVS